MLYNMPPEEDIQIKIFNAAMDSIKSNFPCCVELGSGGTDALYYSIIFEQKFPNSKTI